MTDQLGCIGLGRMGGRRGASLARAGQAAIVYDASAEALERATRLDGISGAPIGSLLRLEAWAGAAGSGGSV